MTIVSNASSLTGKEYSNSDLFLGYHCGVTCSSKLVSCRSELHFVNNQLIMKKKQREQYKSNYPSAITIFRLQGTSDGKLKAYVAQGQVSIVSVKHMEAMV